MHKIIKDSRCKSSIFSNKTCYSYLSTPKSLFLNVNYFYTPYQLISSKGICMSLILAKLLLRSFSHAPHHPIEYHIETLRIASRLIGDEL